MFWTMLAFFNKFLLSPILAGLTGWFFADSLYRRKHNKELINLVRKLTEINQNPIRLVQDGVKSPEEVKALMKTPEDVKDLLNHYFTYCTLLPAIEGFALFMNEHKNFFNLICEEMDKEIIKKSLNYVTMTREELKKIYPDKV